jgi:hypothetical protein
MVDYYGLGVLTPGMGIFHLVFSYSGKITLSVLADRDIMPDHEFYHDCLISAYEELYAAATALKPRAVKNPEVAAKAKIESPKRKRAIATSKPKLASGKKSASSKKSSPKKKAAPKAKTRAKITKPKAAKAKAKPKAKVTKPKTAARPKIKRRSDKQAQPKLKSA